ncbi:hypothetical protein [Flagellimonas sp.]|uniref:hypothetical protein n=1 Tax=Flagellimonas sp. TaxID=2058762 RepID=UPI003B5001EF
MKLKLYLIDATAEKGHVLFLKKLTKILSSRFEVQIISSQAFCKAIGHSSIFELDDRLFKRPTRYHFVINQLRILRKAIAHLPNNATVIFTGTENISFSIISYFLKHKKTYCYLHNNLDKKGLSRFFLKRTSKKVSFIALTQYINDYVEKEIGHTTHYIPHPLNLNPQNTNSSNNHVFGVNLDVSNPEIKRQLIEIQLLLGQKMYIKLNNKSKYSDTIPDVVIKKFYDNYEEVLRSASLVILEVSYNYRVSGVVYECLALNKPIYFIGKKGKFALDILKTYPELSMEKMPLMPIVLEKRNRSYLITHGDNSILDKWANILLN